MPKGDEPPLFDALPMAPEPVCIAMLELWNEFAERNGWALAKKEALDTERRGAIKRAVTTYGGLAGTRRWLEVISGNRFVLGYVGPTGNHKQFKANIDWFIRRRTVRAIIEDGFPDEGAKPPRQAGKSGSANGHHRIDWAARLQRYQAGKFWHLASEGPRPEEPGPHKAPEELVEAWRKKNGVLERRAPERETAEQRLEAMIASHEKIGNHARAEALRAELASLQSKPPSLAPGKQDMARTAEVDFWEIPEPEN